jgi:ABC-type lipoprotein release transport system permease subunit
VLDVNGVGVPTFDIKPVRGDLSFVVTDGRAPAGEREVAIGPATARQLAVAVGDEVTVSPEPQAEGASPLRFTVVGMALFPHEVHSGFTEGVWMQPRPLARLSPPTNFEDFEGVQQVAVLRWQDGVDAEESLASLQQDFSSTDREVTPADVPPELVNLEGVLDLPKILVGFLIALAIAALAHVLVTSVRQRRRDFAILRSIGFTRPMNATVVASHSTAVGLIGLLVGIPVGLVIGRLGWSWVADRVPLVDVAPVALTAILLTIPAAVLIANLVAAWPGRRAATLTPATVLRTE